jgi:hypothetical protein
MPTDANTRELTEQDTRELTEHELDRVAGGVQKPSRPTQSSGG